MIADLLQEKAQKVSHALIRVAAFVRRPYLRSRLEAVSIDVLETVTLKDYEKAVGTISVAKALVDFSAPIYEMETINASLIGSELEVMRDMLKNMIGSGDHTAISKLFENTNRQMNRQSAIKESESAIELPNELPIGQEVAESVADLNLEQEPNDNGGLISIGAAIRQSAILEKIRSMSIRDSRGEIAGCKMKDLLAVFPDVSERTLRNDIQRLMVQGSIERLGNGGATSAYVIK